jgi:hypothetical protein
MYQAARAGAYGIAGGGSAGFGAEVGDVVDTGPGVGRGVGGIAGTAAPASRTPAGAVIAEPPPGASSATAAPADAATASTTAPSRCAAWWPLLSLLIPFPPLTVLHATAGACAGSP